MLQKSKPCYFLLLLFGSSVSTSQVFAQEAVRPQYETSRQSAVTPSGGSTPNQQGVVLLNETESGGNGDLGEQWIYQNSEKPKQWTTVLDVAAYHTSNAGLSSKGALDDNYLVGQLALFWQRAVGNNLVADAGLQQAIYRYDEFSELNFDSLNAGCGVTWQTEYLGGVALSAHYNFNRLTAENYGSELYNAHSLQLGAQRSFQITRADSIIVGSSAQFNLTDPQELERQEYGVYAGYGLAVTRSVVVSASYRAFLYDYNQESRQDFNQSASLGLRWAPCPYLSVGTNLSGTLNRSDRAIFDYNLLSSAVSLTLNYQF